MCSVHTLPAARLDLQSFAAGGLVQLGASRRDRDDRAAAASMRLMPLLSEFQQTRSIESRRRRFIKSPLMHLDRSLSSPSRLLPAVSPRSKIWHPECGSEKGLVRLTRRGSIERPCMPHYSRLHALTDRSLNEPHHITDVVHRAVQRMINSHYQQLGWTPQAFAAQAPGCRSIYSSREDATLKGSMRSHVPPITSFPAEQASGHGEQR